MNLKQIKEQLKFAVETEGEEYKWMGLRNEEIDWLIEQAENTKRYEKTLKEIAEGEQNCKFQSEMGEIDPYDGYEKTMKAKEALEGSK